MSEGTVAEAAVAIQNGDSPHRLSADDLADVTRFRFKERELEVPEIGGTLTLRSLSVEERENLPSLADLKETDDQGERTRRAIRAAAETFAVIVADPKVTADQANEFLGKWPIEAYDRVTEAYGELAGQGTEEDVSRRTFPDGEAERPGSPD